MKSLSHGKRSYLLALLWEAGERRRVPGLIRQGPWRYVRGVFGEQRIGAPRKIWGQVASLSQDPAHLQRTSDGKTRMRIV